MLIENNLDFILLHPLLRIFPNILTDAIQTLLIADDMIVIATLSREMDIFAIGVFGDTSLDVTNDRSYGLLGDTICE